MSKQSKIQDKFWKTVQKQGALKNPEPVQIGTVLQKVPLQISYKGVTIGKEFGDNIYLNNLLLDDNIELDLSSMDEPQNINPALWKADNTPTGTVEISGTQKQFITDFYNYFKAWHKRYIIDIGDFVAIQRLGNNTYIILQKVQKDVN